MDFSTKIFAGTDFSEGENVGTKTKTIITIETRKVTLIKRISSVGAPAADIDAVECRESESYGADDSDDRTIDRDSEIRRIDNRMPEKK